MPRLIALLLLLLTLLGAVPAFAGYCQNGPLASSPTGDGESTIRLYVTPEQLAGVTPWVIGPGSPPVSLQGAITAAQKWASTHYTRRDGVADASGDLPISSVTLRTYRCNPGEPKHSLWVVEFVPWMGPTEGFEYRGVAVLMNGTLIVPTKVAL